MTETSSDNTLFVFLFVFFYRNYQTTNDTSINSFYKDLYDQNLKKLKAFGNGKQRVVINEQVTKGVI